MSRLSVLLKSDNQHLCQSGKFAFLNILLFLSPLPSFSLSETSLFCLFHIFHFSLGCSMQHRVGLRVTTLGLDYLRSHSGSITAATAQDETFARPHRTSQGALTGQGRAQVHRGRARRPPGCRRDPFVLTDLNPTLREL